MPRGNKGCSEIHIRALRGRRGEELKYRPRATMPMKAPGEQVTKTVAFGSHGGPVALEVNRTDHVANTPYTRQTNLSNNPHRPLNKMSVALHPNRNLGFRRMSFSTTTTINKASSFPQVLSLRSLSAPSRLQTKIHNLSLSKSRPLLPR